MSYFYLCSVSHVPRWIKKMHISPNHIKFKWFPLNVIPEHVLKQHLFLLWFKLFLLFNKMGQRDLNKMCFWSFYGLKVIKKCLPRFTKYKKCFIERAVNVHVLYAFKYLFKNSSCQKEQKKDV